MIALHDYITLSLGLETVYFVWTVYRMYVILYKKMWVEKNSSLELINMFNKNWCPLAGRRIKTPFVMFVSAFTPEIECQPFLRSK